MEITESPHGHQEKPPKKLPAGTWTLLPLTPRVPQLVCTLQSPGELQQLLSVIQKTPGGSTMQASLGPLLHCPEPGLSHQVKMPALEGAAPASTPRLK